MHPRLPRSWVERRNTHCIADTAIELLVMAFIKGRYFPVKCSGAILYKGPPFAAFCYLLDRAGGHCFRAG